MTTENNLPQEKADYLFALLCGRKVKQLILEAAMIFYHAEIPLQDASEYLSILENKVNPRDDIA